MAVVRRSQISVHYAPKVTTLNASPVKKVNNYLTRADNTNSKTQNKEEMHKIVSMRPNSAIVNKQVEEKKTPGRPNSATVVKNIVDPGERLRDVQAKLFELR